MSTIIDLRVYYCAEKCDYPMRGNLILSLLTLLSTFSLMRISSDRLGSIIMEATRNETNTVGAIGIFIVSK